MQSITAGEAKLIVDQSAFGLGVTDQNVVCYHNQYASHIVVRIPAEHRAIVALAYSTLLLEDQDRFEGGLVWLRHWEVGSPQMVRPGWKILETLRRSQGDIRSLEIAPAQLFRHDEFVELHAFLIQVMGFGWSAYFFPFARHYFVSFQTNERFICYADSAAELSRLNAALQRWNPSLEENRS